MDNWTLLVSMLFCHFAKTSSLRDISYGLRSATRNLNHLGIENRSNYNSTFKRITKLNDISMVCIEFSRLYWTEFIHENSFILMVRKSILQTSK